MKTLYNIYESLLDDEDIVMTNADKSARDSVVAEMIKLLQDLSEMKRWRIGQTLTGRMEGSTLCLDCRNTFTINEAVMKVILRYKDLLKFDSFKSISPLQFIGIDNLQEHFQTISAPSIEVSAINYLKDIHINIIESDILAHQRRGFKSVYGFNFYMKNVTMTVDRNVNGAHIEIDCMPAFFNCKFEGFTTLRIHKKELFKIPSALNTIDQLFDKKYKARVATYDVLPVIKSCSARNLRAIANGMLKTKYKQYGLKGDPYIKFKPNAKLDMLFEDIKCLGNIELIQLADDDVYFNFWNLDVSPAKEKLLNTNSGVNPMSCELPNENWLLNIY